MTEKIYLASDHGGVILKDKLVNHLKSKNVEVIDLGPEVGNSVDYPDYADKLCNAVLESPNSRGILICGTGIGMSIAANKISGIKSNACLGRVHSENESRTQQLQCASFR